MNKLERRARWYRYVAMARRLDIRNKEEIIKAYKSELARYQLLLEKAKIFLSDEELAKLNL